MIGYITLGTNNYEKAINFYDRLLGSIGISRVMEQEGHYVAWAPAMDAPAISIVKPFDEKPASVGNGVMVALPMQSTDQVDAFHAKALALGGVDEGAPGFRHESNMPGFYVSYFRDLDGNKFNAFYTVTGK